MTARPRPQLPQRLPAGRAPLGFGSTPARCTALAEEGGRGEGLGLERGLARRHGTRGCAGCFSRTLRASLASPQLDPLGLPSSVSSPCSAHWPAYFSRRSARQVSVQFSSVQSSRVRLFVNPRTAARQASLSITNSRNLLKLMSIESVMLSNHFIVCRPLLLSPALTLSQHQGLFQGVSSSHQVAKVLEFQLQHRV